MTDITKSMDTDQDTSVYDELPDAPPKQKIRLSIIWLQVFSNMETL